MGSFETFVRETEPRLRRALAGHLSIDVIPDALAEAYAYAWQHWDRVQQLDNPAGYLFRVAQSRSRHRRQGLMESRAPTSSREIEPGLERALHRLTQKQRSAVWLVYGCGWTYAEAAASLGISPSAVGTHLQRGLRVLRRTLGALNND